jgi:hypothetical protein
MLLIFKSPFISKTDKNTDANQGISFMKTDTTISTSWLMWEEYHLDHARAFWHKIWTCDRQPQNLCHICWLTDGIHQQSWNGACGIHSSGTNCGPTTYLFCGIYGRCGGNISISGELQISFSIILMLLLLYFVCAQISVSKRATVLLHPIYVPDPALYDSLSFLKLKLVVKGNRLEAITGCTFRVQNKGLLQML